MPVEKSMSSATAIVRGSTESPKLRKRAEQAAQLVAEDRHGDERISEIVGIARRTLARWKKKKPFLARVEEINEAFARRALKEQLARRERRLAVLNEKHDKLLQIIEERAADPSMASVPGGKTGLLTRTVKGIGKGDDYQVVEVYEVDTAILREIRAIHQQVAEELGQWKVKVEASGPDSGPIRVSESKDAKERLYRLLLPERFSQPQPVETEGESIR